MAKRVQEGERVFLYQDARRRWIATISRTRFHTHRGFVDLESLIGISYGQAVKTSMGQLLWVFQPSPSDIVETFNRPTQILYPKDIGYALYRLGVKPGDRIVEVGTGSGAMTAALARAVSPGGHVYSYEIRPEFLKAAHNNLETAGVSHWVTLRNKNPAEGFDETDADAIVLDLGDPWTMTAPARAALVDGGMLSAFTPTFNQLEKLGESLRKESFLILESVEVLLREMKTEAGKLRPESRMVGHTAYITIARKVTKPEGLK